MRNELASAVPQQRAEAPADEYGEQMDGDQMNRARAASIGIER
ncbi:hypothetical protein [Antricoccus suffuscus]|nr:hypothetical protein [Antricoccus suffuscus]